MHRYIPTILVLAFTCIGHGISSTSHRQCNLRFKNIVSTDLSFDELYELSLIILSRPGDSSAPRLYYSEGLFTFLRSHLGEDLESREKVAIITTASLQSMVMARANRGFRGVLYLIGIEMFVQEINSRLVDAITRNYDWDRLEVAKPQTYVRKLIWQFVQRHKESASVVKNSIRQPTADWDFIDSPSLNSPNEVERQRQLDSFYILMNNSLAKIIETQNPKAQTASIYRTILALRQNLHAGYFAISTMIAILFDMSRQGASNHVQNLAELLKDEIGAGTKKEYLRFLEESYNSTSPNPLHIAQSIANGSPKVGTQTFYRGNIVQLKQKFYDLLTRIQIHYQGESPKIKGAFAGEFLRLNLRKPDDVFFNVLYETLKIERPNSSQKNQIAVTPSIKNKNFDDVTRILYFLLVELDVIPKLSAEL